jgi:SAM-dependent methyltransferase
MAEQDRVLHSIEEVTATLEGVPAGTATSETAQAASGDTGDPPEGERTYGSRDRIPPEDFPRVLIDRKINAVDGFFRRSFGAEQSILQTTAGRAQALGSVTLLDVGCGTGNALCDLATFVRGLVDDPSKVTALGVNLHDYSKESSSARTREAIATGKVGYTVGDAEQLDKIFPGVSADIVVGCMSLIHMQRPTLVAMQIARILSPGGVAFFNLPAHLSEPDSSFVQLGQKLEDFGFIFRGVVGLMPGRTPDDKWKTFFVRMEKPDNR